MKKLIISLLILVASAMSASVYAETTVYEGTIGQYKIHMVVDENFNGYYYYDHRPDSRFKLVKTSKVECTEDDDYYYYWKRLNVRVCRMLRIRLKSVCVCVCMYIEF